jgi:hypothetical protein
MGWLDGLAASLIGGALSAIYEQGTLHKVPVDHNGVPTGDPAVDYAVRGQVDNWSTNDLSRSNIPPGSSKIFVVRQGSPAVPTPEDSLTLKGQVFKLGDFPNQDPAGVCWTMIGVPYNG